MNTPEAVAAATEVATTTTTTATGGSNVLWIIVGITGVIIMFIAWRKRKPVMEDVQDLDQTEEAIAYLERPRKVHGGRWAHYQVKLVECAPPVSNTPPRIENSAQRQAARR